MGKKACLVEEGFLVRDACWEHNIVIYLDSHAVWHVSCQNLYTVALQHGTQSLHQWLHIAKGSSYYIVPKTQCERAGLV